MSIWGTLAGIAASAIPGVGPFIAPIVGGAVNSLTAGGGSSGGGAPGGTSSTQANTLAAQNLLNSQLGYSNAKTASDMGFGQIQQASDALSQPQNYFQSILNGDRAATTQALAPQIAQIQQSLQQALTTGSTLNARGGGRASTLASLPSQATTQISNLYDTARPAAATSLADIATRRGALGSSLLGSGGSFLSGGTTANLGGLANHLLANQQNFDQSKAIGGSLGDILAGLKSAGGLSGIFKNLKGAFGKSGSPGSGGGGVDFSSFGLGDEG